MSSADKVVVCRTPDGAVVGFATQITDYRFAANIPLVDVLPEYQGRGICSQMVLTLLERLRSCYMIDLVCDDGVVPSYERLGGIRLNAAPNHPTLQPLSCTHHRRVPGSAERSLFVSSGFFRGAAGALGGARDSGALTGVRFVVGPGVT